MDRLLEDTEIYDTECEWLFEWSQVPEQYKLDLLKAQDAKTAHLVAQDILDELEEKCNCYPGFDFEDIKGACPRV